MNLMPLVQSYESFDVLLPAGDLIKHFLNNLQATKFVAVYKAGVKPDFIRQIEEHRTPRSVPEKYCIGKAMRVVNKLIADPEKIGIRLVF